MGNIEVKIDLGGTIELAIFLTIVLAVGRALKLWTFSWWWVASPVLALVGIGIIGVLVVYLVLIIKGLAERRL